MFFVFFCFKQKTAYEMRISDWSSDVCSSDLAAHQQLFGFQAEEQRGAQCDDECAVSQGERPTFENSLHERRVSIDQLCDCHHGNRAEHRGRPDRTAPRSEEHTSELQSLMRNSYAVFCLKKKQHNNTNHRKVNQLDNHHYH